MKGKITCILITETWLDANSDILCEIPGYTSHNFYRDGVGGGLKLYILDFIHPSIYVSPETDHCELISISAIIPGFKKILICGIYRPPNKSVPEFLNFMESYFDSVGRESCVILGDLNLNYLDDSNPNILRYKNILNCYCSENSITIPTYVSPSTLADESCLDHILYNFSNETVSYVLEPALADHYAAITIFDTSSIKKPISLKFRDYSMENVRNYSGSIHSEFQSFDPYDDDVDKYTENIINFSKKLINKYFPKKIKKISNKNFNAPWITPIIKKCIAKKHRWHRMAKSGIISDSSYKKICKSVQYLTQIAEQEYHRSKLLSLGNKPDKNWKLLQKLLGKKPKTISDTFIIQNENCTDPQKIANEFNKHFINHPMNIHTNIKNTNANFLSLIERQQNSMFFEPCTEQEILTEIAVLKKRGHIDDISSKFLKLSANYLSEHICKLFNRCIQMGTFPKAFKISRITPIRKKGPTNEIKNHRPISVLTNFSKLFESIIYKRLKQYFEHINVLNPNQFGYRKGRSTEQAVFSMLDRVITAFECKAYAVCIFLDYSACFDTISRELLIKKLERYGVRGTTLKLFESYFETRQQFVEFNEKKSYIAEQSLGVIQGSKCGPLFYDIYTSELSKLCSEDEFLMYADDTCILYTGEDLSRVVQLANERLKTIHDWCCANKLALNTNKSNFMLFTNKLVHNEPIIKLDQNKIARVSEFKYLGVTIDEKLKYGGHIEYLRSTMSRMCGLSFRLSKHLDVRAAKNIYFSCVYSVLTFSICVYGGVLQCTQRAQRLINYHEKVVKNLFSKFCPESTCLFKHLKLLKLRDIHKLYAAIYVFKVTKLNECPTVKKNLNLKFPQHHHYTRSRENPLLPIARVNAVKINFKHQCTQIWNNLPHNIKSIQKLKPFKRALTGYFVDQY